MNAILLVIDSLDYTRCQKSEVDLLPNIRKRSKNGICCENMYSQAPFTEAATVALYCGQNTLDNHGYLEQFNNVKTTLMEVMKENGYETFYNSFQPQCFSSSLRRGVDNIMYNRGYDNRILYNYRFEYYINKYNRGEFDKYDYQQIARILSDCFEEWIRFLDAIIHDEESVYMIRELNKEYNAEHIRELVIKEKKAFESDPDGYFISIVNAGAEHSFFNIPFFEQVDFDFSKDSSRFYNRELKSFVRRIRRKNFAQNIVYNKDVAKHFVQLSYAFATKDNKSFDQEKRVIKNALFMTLNNKKYGGTCHSLKGQPSFDKHIRSFMEWKNSRRDKIRPYFAIIHVDDIHLPEMFFSYDSNDIEILREELNTSKDCLKKRKKGAGTISLDLSLRYIDLVCERLLSELEKTGQLRNTIVFVTADHGFSYSASPIRSKAVNTFYLENYKIPFFSIGGEIKKIEDYSLRSSVDIPTTICDCLGIKIPSGFVGKSVLQPNDADRIITIEYCGEGCPDINSKKLMIAAFDLDYLVAGFWNIDNQDIEDSVTEIYDLRRDPLQLDNLVDRIDFAIILRYVNAIRKRLKEIKETNEMFLSTLDGKKNICRMNNE